MTLIESIRNYFLTCPLLEDGKINVDFADCVVDMSYNIDVVPGNPIVKRFVDGGSQRQVTFIFSSCEPWGNDTLQNLDNNGFYEQLAAWIEENKTVILDDNKQFVKIEPLTYGYLMSNDSDKAYYQIQLRLIYNQDK